MGRGHGRSRHRGLLLLLEVLLVAERAEAVGSWRAVEATATSAQGLHGVGLAFHVARTPARLCACVFTRASERALSLTLVENAEAAKVLRSD